MENTDVDKGLVALKAMFDGLTKKDKVPAGKAYKNIEAGVNYGGSKIVLPDDPYRMKIDEAVEMLNRLKAAEEQVVRFVEPIQGVHPWDGAVAFMKAMKNIYGWAQPVPTPGFFGDSPPTTISIETDVGETAMIFWGRFKLPGIEADLNTHVDMQKGRPVFTIVGQTRKKYVEAIHALAEETRRIVNLESIYRGKALRLTVIGSDLDYNVPPTFMDLRKVNEAELVFSESLLDMVQTNLWTPIEYTARCREEKIPLKRGVLLEGPYGTGKTLTATVTAKKCVANGWTFLTVPHASAIEPALHFAAQYQPCVLFVEDIDREMNGERTQEMDNILNTIDGIISKGSEIMVVLTSNHAEMINRAMLRPGRLDAVLHIDAPDGPAAQKLLRVYGRKLIKKDEDLTEAGEALAGRVPAVIREVVERSKLHAVSRSPSGAFFLTGADMVRAAKTMDHHLALLEGAKPEPTTSQHRMGQALLEMLDSGLANGLAGGLSARLKDMQEKVDDLHQNEGL